MSELNEEVQVTVDDAPMATVPLVDNLTADNAAPKASTVGAALSLKADAATIMESVTITVDGQESDNQGVIMLCADDIPMSENDATKVSAAIAAVDAKNASNIQYALGVSVKDKIDTVASSVSSLAGSMYADQIPMASTDSTKISAAIADAAARTAADITYSGDVKIYGKVETINSAVTTISANYLSKQAQTLTPEQQTQARANIGLGTAAVKGVANDLVTSDSGGYVLDAAQGYAINQVLNPLNTNFGSLFMLVNYPFSFEGLASGDNKSFTAADLEMTAITGYTPVAIVGVVTGYANVAMTRFNLTSGSSYVLTLKNLASSALTANGSITVLYARTAAVVQNNA